MSSRRPYVVALGGASRPNSSTERALRFALDAMGGADTVLLGSADLDLPLYAPHSPVRCTAAQRLVDELRRADAVLIGSPGYHGGISGLVKNALDYTEDLRADVRPYLSGRAVGCVVTAGGWQGAVTTLCAMRDMVHALRGWLTPMGVCIAGTEPAFAPDGSCVSPQAATQLGLMAGEVMEFVAMRAATSARAETPLYA